MDEFLDVRPSLKLNQDKPFKEGIGKLHQHPI